MKKIVFSILVLFLISACKKNEFEKHLNIWKNKKIQFPEKLHTKCWGKDTLIPSLLQHKYKILVYINNEGCTSCKLKLPSWSRLIEQTDSLNYDVSFLFICHFKNFEEIEFLQKDNKFRYPLIYDYKDSFNILNKFPDSFLFRTLLLDENNKVLMIGNPVFIPNLWYQYKKILAQPNTKESD